MEIWKPVVNWEGIYEVSNMGRIKRIDDNNCAKSGHIMKPIKLPSGYAIVRLRYKGRTEAKLIHKFVAEAFIGARPDRHQINHLNGIRDDNRVANLEYCTCSQNIQHSYDALHRVRKGAIGERNCKAKLNEQQVKEIRRLYADGGISQQRIADQYGVTQNMISKIVLRHFWKHLTD